MWVYNVTTVSPRKYPLDLHATLGQKWVGGICSNIDHQLATMVASFRTESTVHGHHSTVRGEDLLVQCEVSNIQDDFTVAI